MNLGIALMIVAVVYPVSSPAARTSRLIISTIRLIFIPMSTQVIDRILSAAQRSFGLSMCIHTMSRQHPSSWALHQSPPCLAMKRRNRDRCRAFDAQQVHQEIQATPEGRIHRCPFGFTEIAIPLIHLGKHVGVLFAGPTWTESTSPPHPQLTRINHNHLQDFLVLLKPIADRLAELLDDTTLDERAETIQTFVHQNLKQSLSLNDLAERLALSPDRTRHLVKELFGTSLSQLIQTTRLTEAARHLIITDLPVGDIANRFGYGDQNYFARLFRRQFKLTPSAYRKSHALE